MFISRWYKTATKNARKFVNFKTIKRISEI